MKPRPSWTPEQWETAISDAVEWVNQPHLAPRLARANVASPGAGTRGMRRMASILSAATPYWAAYVFAWRFEAYLRERGVVHP